MSRNECECCFENSDSWVILSPIEQSIKRKIEAAGTPLKDWDINIYRGVLTGYNEAFIISGEKRNEILSNCKTPEERAKTDELIRPILRGRDIKRYSYNFADLWLINTHNGIKEKGILPVNIEEFPAIKAHLDSFGDKLKKRTDKGNTPYNLRNCAYMEDFSKQKIVWAELARTGNAFVLDSSKFMVGNTAYILTTPKGREQDLMYLLGILNSRIILYYMNLICSRLDETGWRWLRQFVEILPIPQINSANAIREVVAKITLENQKEMSEEINKHVASLYGLTPEEIDFISEQLGTF
ncbi:MAG: hypothetical protein IJN19_01865 [Opitutales bacterium]|nr:hypothetical protein [Opitutales bacterium]